ncbi:MAG: KpsF/GutQ family sugar-phosphate isomerase [Acidobacteriota bacterium]
MTQDPRKLNIIELGKRVLKLEAAALQQVSERLNENFAQAVLLLASSPGKVICSGVGKAGLIAQKVAATFASTGIPAFFLHPAEAMHGDLGMAARGDIALIFSNSGESEEVIRLLPHLRSREVYRVAITARQDSSLGHSSDLVLELGVLEEACPLQLAPSSSTTALLAMGDALALAALDLRGFTMEDYARLHPGGSIGRLMSRVEGLMRTGARCPTVVATANVRVTVTTITRARAGLACVVDEAGRLLGVFTDGDFRRHWERNGEIGDLPVSNLMTRPGLHVYVGMLVRDAKSLMGERHVNALPVLDQEQRVVGLLDLQDIV